MRRIAKKHGVSLAFSSSNTIKSGLIKEKTEIKKKRYVVYQVSLNCGKSYIGESGQLWEERKKQHLTAFKNNDEKKSAILEHVMECKNMCNENNPGVKWEEAKILARETMTDKRRIRESLEIKLQNKKQHKTINRNQGQPELNNIWEKAITTFIMNQPPSSVRSIQTFPKALRPSAD